MRIRAGLAFVLLASALAQAADGDSLPLLERIADQHRLTPSEVGRLEAALARNAWDLSSRTRLLAHYLSVGDGHARVGHSVWVVTHQPGSKLAGSPLVRITVGAGNLNTRSDYEALRAVWAATVERHSGKPDVLSNAARFFEAEETGRAADLLRKAWQLEPANPMRRPGLVQFFTRILAKCEAPQPGCPGPSWLLQVKAELDSLRERP